MFDLFRSRQKATRILLTVLLGAVALSMLVYLIPGASVPTAGRNDQVIAEIGPESVTVRDIEMQIRGFTQGRQISPDVISGLIPQIVEEAITDRALAYDAQRLGFQVTDADLATNIRSNPQFAEIPPQQYRMYIEQQLNLTVPEFEHNYRLDLFSKNVQNLAMEGAYVSPQEVQAEYKRRNDTVKLDYIAFDPVKVAADIKPATQELKDYYDKNKGLFFVQETRNAQLLVADELKIAEAVTIPDVQIQSYYNSHKDQYRTKERIKVRHILITILNKTPAQIAQQKAKAEDILKQLKAGADFAKLAEQYSDDKTNAAKGGDLGWVTRGQMVPEAENPIFALKKNEISSVIPAPYGFHIAQVLEKEEAHQQSLDEVRTQVIAALKSQVVTDRMQSLADQGRSELVKTPQNGQQIAGKLGLLFANVDKFKPGDTLPELGNDAQVGGVIASLPKGGVSQVLQSGSKLVVAVVTTVNPPHPAQFEEAESQVRTRYTQEKSVQLATEKANKAAEILKTNGGDLKAAAKAVGLEVKTTSPFNRSGAAEGIGDARYLGDAFDKPVGTIVGPLNVTTQTVVAKIVDRTTADMSKLDQERETIVLQLKRKKSIERSDLTRDSVLNYLVQKGKVKIHQDVIDLLQKRYRS